MLEGLPLFSHFNRNTARLKIIFLKDVFLKSRLKWVMPEFKTPACLVDFFQLCQRLDRTGTSPCPVQELNQGMD